jgi:hypothetical protein
MPLAFPSSSAPCVSFAPVVLSTPGSHPLNEYVRPTAFDPRQLPRTLEDFGPLTPALSVDEAAQRAERHQQLLDAASFPTLIQLPVTALGRDPDNFMRFMRRLGTWDLQRRWMLRQAEDGMAADLFSIGLVSAVRRNDAEAFQEALEQLSHPGYRHVGFDLTDAIKDAVAIGSTPGSDPRLGEIWREHCAKFLQEGRLTPSDHRRLAACFDTAA